MSLKVLRERAGEIAAKIRTKAETPQDKWSAEDETEWKRLNDEYDATAAQLARFERAEELDKKSRHAPESTLGNDDVPPEKGGGGSDKSQRNVAADQKLALRAWMKRAYSLDLTDAERAACRAAKLNPGSKEFGVRLCPPAIQRQYAAAFRSSHPTVHERALSAVTAGSGGILVPGGFLNTLEMNMLAHSNILADCMVLRTDSGNELPMPYADDTSNTGEIVGESASVDGSTDPTFGARILRAYKFSSKMVKVPQEMFEDSAFDPDVFLGEMLGIRLGRIINTKLTTGTGVNGPEGYTLSATLGVTAASATAITADELTVDLPHSIDPAYRANGVYILHDSILAYIRKMKDGEGRSLFQSNLAVGFPDTISGRRYIINQDQASSVATTNKTVFFGDPRKIVVRQVNGIRIRRLVERYADVDQVGFVAFMRLDSKLMNAGTAPLKYLQQA